MPFHGPDCPSGMPHVSGWKDALKSGWPLLCGPSMESGIPLLQLCLSGSCSAPRVPVHSCWAEMSALRADSGFANSGSVLSHQVWASQSFSSRSMWASSTMSSSPGRCTTSFPPSPWSCPGPTATTRGTAPPALTPLQATPATAPASTAPLGPHQLLSTLSKWGASSPGSPKEGGTGALGCCWAAATLPPPSVFPRGDP